MLFQNAEVHAIIAIIAIILSPVQVVMALCRPGKDAKMRPYFNWAHRITGTTAAIAAGELSTLIKILN